MRKAICIVVLVYYSLGSLLLPLADFSMIPQLPKLYAHCKATEDKDMGLIDFVTDHLLNIDGMFDKHENGDEQKAHEPFDHSVSQNFTFVINNSFIEISEPKETTQERVSFPDKIYHFDLVGNVFRPPIA
jgi:hypothetical protein